jgi:hypothetical protein
MRIARLVEDKIRFYEGKKIYEVFQERVKSSDLQNVYFLFDYDRVNFYDVEDVSDVYRYLAEQTGKSDIYYKIIKVNGRSIAFVLPRDTYFTLKHAGVRKAFSFPFLVVYALSKELKGGVVFYDGFAYIYYDGFNLIVEPIAEDFLNRLKELYRGTIYNLSHEHINIPDANDVIMNELEIVEKIKKYFNSNLDVFHENYEAEKISPPKSVVNFLVVSIFFIFLSVISPALSKIVSTLVPYNPIANSVVVPSISSVAGVSAFVYNKSSDYILYEYRLQNGSVVTFVNLEDAKQFKDKFPNATLWKVTYQNNNKVKEEPLP